MRTYKSLDIQFQNSQDITLAAKLDLPENPSHFAIFSPCFTCTKETLATYRISQMLAKKNIAVLRIDFTGLGESDGDFGDSNFNTQIDDILAANQFLQDHYQLPEILIGHSMGGTASYEAANKLTNIKAIISIASPSAPSHVLHHFGDALEHIKAGKDSEFFVAGKAYSIKPQFLMDLENHELEETIHNLHKAILIFHGENDQLVDISHAEKIFSIAQQPKSFVSLDTANHV
ncbi:MAG: alpha/beta hydrolase, partial [Gammaproteobacteria bacterium]|nr:alpha/beta hydrolase [Gammaproteobacteria bacterium]